MKWLHIEIIDGQLYVYRSTRKFKAVVKTPEDLAKECRIKEQHICVKVDEKT